MISRGSGTVLFCNRLIICTLRWLACQMAPALAPVPLRSDDLMNVFFRTTCAKNRTVRFSPQVPLVAQEDMSDESI